jgi:hypothetical protein
METIAMIRQVFKEKSLSHALVIERKSPDSPRLRKAQHMKSTVKSMFIFFDIKGIVHKEFILACQTVKSIYYCEV